jgi:riboflavin synthase
MFTGIIEAVGRVRQREPLGAGIRLVIETELAADLAPGESVAVDGVCLTATGFDGASFVVDAIGTTLSRTTIGSMEPGRRVNLERALPLGARLGGHLVQGHVDGVGTVLRIQPVGEHVLADLRMPVEVAHVTVLHGSIAVNGVSMTVNELPAAGVAQIAVIPFTWAHTMFPDLREGDAVNLEGDMIGRFVVSYLERTGAHAQIAAAAERGG